MTNQNQRDAIYEENLSSLEGENTVIDIANKNILTVEKTIIGKANDLAREHEQLDLHITVGRQMLYDLLTKMHVLACELDINPDHKLIVRQMRIELATKWGIKTQDNTSDTAVLVRYITRADRKTAHVYARVIEVAKANQVRSGYLNGFIERKGGIERIRANSVTTGATSKNEQDIAKERLQLVREYLEARKECPYSSFKIGNKSNDLDKPNALNFFVCSERHGRYYILAKLPVTSGQSHELISSLADQLCNQFVNAKAAINTFSRKAQKKSAQRIRRSLMRKFPKLAEKFKKRNTTAIETLISNDAYTI